MGAGCAWRLIRSPKEPTVGAQQNLRVFRRKTTALVHTTCRRRTAPSSNNQWYGLMIPEQLFCLHFNSICDDIRFPGTSTTRPWLPLFLMWGAVGFWGPLSFWIAQDSMTCHWPWVACLRSKPYSPGPYLVWHKPRTFPSWTFDLFLEWLPSFLTTRAKGLHIFLYFFCWR